MRSKRSRQTVLFLLLALVLGLEGQQFGARARAIGAQLICTCGCTQGAIVCNHVGCPVVTQMRAEIVERAASTDSDALVLQSFVQEYGTQVLANPTTQGFNLVAWIVPWVALGLGMALLLWLIGRWRRLPAAAAAAGGLDPGTPEQAEVRREIADQIEKEWKR
ncbi:MAG: cytochrome c-type biogenesis protein CcmH [Terriglobales bacterium]